MIVAVIASLSLRAQVTDKGTVSPPVVTVCEVLSVPQKYDGRPITISGRVKGTGEGAWLYSAECPGAYSTKDYVWPSVIALAMPTLRTPPASNQCQFHIGLEVATQYESEIETFG